MAYTPHRLCQVLREKTWQHDRLVNPEALANAPADLRQFQVPRTGRRWVATREWLERTRPTVVQLFYQGQDTPNRTVSLTYKDDDMATNAGDALTAMVQVQEKMVDHITDTNAKLVDVVVKLLDKVDDEPSVLDTVTPMILSGIQGGSNPLAALLAQGKK